jgi:hypothetical protein
MEANSHQRMGPRSLLRDVIGLHTVHDELAQRRPAQMWEMRCFACYVAQKWDDRGAYPCLELVSIQLSF